jgi:hypothetical protein
VRGGNKCRYPWVRAVCDRQMNSLDRSRRPDQFGDAFAVSVRDPGIAHAVDRQANRAVKPRPGRGEIARQRPVVVQRGRGRSPFETLLDETCLLAVDSIDVSLAVPRNEAVEKTR